MNKSITPDITITIQGAPGSGKSTLLHLIGKNLLNQGMNVQCIERFRSGTVEESYPVQPVNTAHIQRDDRLIQIIALDSAGECKSVPDGYTQITQTVRTEIQRLVEKSREKLPNENGEIYREWAYGVFLAWKAITGINAKAGDEKLLEAMATGEQPF
jgi:ATPase subunit of ABC transporter with duplicated ATPase domains